MKSLCVMPVYNQIRDLPLLLERCRESMPADLLYIVDNGSTDGGGELIAESGFAHIRLDRNYGVGYALRLGAEKALELNYDIVVNIAGNGKMLPTEMTRILEPILSDQADYVTGSRFLDGGAYPNLPLFRRVSIPLVVNNLVLLLYWRKLTDATNGYRAFRTTLLSHPKVKWREPWLYHYQFEYYLYAKALKLGLRCLEVPTTMFYPASKKNYSKIRPFVGWYEMLQPWVLVGLGLR